MVMLLGVKAKAPTFEPLPQSTTEPNVNPETKTPETKTEPTKDLEANPTKVSEPEPIVKTDEPSNKVGEAFKDGGSGARKVTPEETANIDQIRKDFKISKGKNIAHLECEIDGKPIDLKSYSGKDTRPGTVDPVPPEKQQLKTQPTSGDKAKGQTDLNRRDYDSEVKALENILSETTPESTGKIKLSSERDLCGSYSDAVKQFKILRPNIDVETVYSIPYSNPL